MATIKVFALGGLDERGKNMYVVEVDNDIFIFDAGTKTPTREALGIDTVIPDFSYLKKNQNRIKGLFISKPSDDCFGAVAYLLKEVNIPVYSSKLGIFLVKQKLDSLKTWYSENQLIEINAKDTILFNKNSIEVFNTTTCIPDSFGFSLKTVDGSIVYTGDYIFDSEKSTNFNTDMPHLYKISSEGVLLLLSDTGYANREEYTAPYHKLRKWIDALFKESTGKIIIVCNEQDLYKINEIFSLINENQKEMSINNNKPEVIVIGRMLQLIINRFKDNIKYLNTKNITFKDIKDIKDNSIVFITGMGQRLYTRVHKIITGDEKFLQINNNDTVIFATSPLPGYELKHARVLDDLARTDARIISFSDKKVWDMNASFEDIKLMISIMKPKFFMPVKGLYKNFTYALNAAIDAGVLINNILIKDNGQPLVFVSGKLIPSKNIAKYSEQILKDIVSDIYVDGLGVGDIGAVVLKERKALSSDGVLIAGITLNKKTKKIISLVDIQMRGVIFIQEDEELISKMRVRVKEIIEEYQSSSEFDNTTVKNKIRSELQDLCNKETGKSPMVLAIINEA